MTFNITSCETIFRVVVRSQIVVLPQSLSHNDIPVTRTHDLGINIICLYQVKNHQYLAESSFTLKISYNSILRISNFIQNSIQSKLSFKNRDILLNSFKIRTMYQILKKIRAKVNFPPCFLLHIPYTLFRNLYLYNI